MAAISRYALGWTPANRWVVARAMVIGLTALGAGLWLWFVSIRAGESGVDAHAYFVGKYGALGGPDAYLYSPLFSQLVEPLRWLGWDGFRTAWRLAEVGALVGLTGPLSGVLVFSNPMALEVLAGNIHLFVALAVIAGFRWPATWAFVLLTKVTPGIGLLWFAVRREWRKAGVALLTTTAAGMVSYLLDPAAWGAWVATLVRPDAVAPAGVGLDWPLFLRLPIAGVMVSWAGLTDRRWVMPIAAVMAMPVIWLTSLSVLVAIPFLVGSPALVRLFRPRPRTRPRPLVAVGPGRPSEETETAEPWHIEPRMPVLERSDPKPAEEALAGRGEAL